MIYACLVPITRPLLAQKAIQSAEKDGYKVYYLEDIKREGPDIIRERLFDIAIKDDVDYIRYLDDDDILLPHREQIQFQDYDVIYMQHFFYYPKEDKYIRCMPYSGNLSLDAKNLAPWSWIATTDALKRIKKQFGSIWPLKNQGCYDGAWCCLNFLKGNLKATYQDIEHYVFNQYDDPLRFYNKPVDGFRHEVYLEICTEIEKYEKPLSR